MGSEMCIRDSTLIDMRFAKPFDKERIDELSSTHQHLITIEDNVVTGGAGSSLAAITPIFANSKILVTFMFSLRMGDGNRLGVMAYVSMASNMSNLARISDYRGSTGNESYRSSGSTDWSSHTLFAVDDGSYSGSGGQIPMSTSQRFYNIGYYNASGDGAVYYGDHSQRIYLILQEIKQ